MILSRKKRFSYKLINKHPLNDNYMILIKSFSIQQFFFLSFQLSCHVKTISLILQRGKFRQLSNV